MWLFSTVLCLSCLTLSLCFFWSFILCHFLFTAVFALDWFSSGLRAPPSSHCQCPNVSFSFPPLCVYTESLLTSLLWLSDSPWLHPTFFLPSKIEFPCRALFVRETNTCPKEKYSFIYLFIHYVYVCVLVQVCGSLCLMPVFGVIAIRA